MGSESYTTSADVLLVRVRGSVRVRGGEVCVGGGGGQRNAGSWRALNCAGFSSGVVENEVQCAPLCWCDVTLRDFALFRWHLDVADVAVVVGRWLRVLERCCCCCCCCCGWCPLVETY